MGTTKKPRKKYRPRPVLRNPLGYVLETVMPLRDHEFPLLTLKIKHSESMCALLGGTAKRGDIDRLVDMSNIVRALYQMGFGVQYKDVADEGRDAIVRVVDRAVKHGRFTPTGPEIRALNLLMELHDAQMEVITVGDIERAVASVEAQIRAGGIRLPVVPDCLR